MGVAAGMGAPLPLVAGAVVSGAYFGDKMSPLSDTTNLAPIAAGAKLYDHIGHMFYTTIPGCIICLIVYTIAGFSLAGGGTVATPEKVETILATLDGMFKFNPLVILPPVIDVYKRQAMLTDQSHCCIEAAAAGCVQHIAVCEGQPVMIRRNRVLRHICRLFPVVDLKDISEDLAVLDGFRDNDAGNALVVGLLRIKTEGVVISRSLNKELIFIEAVCSLSLIHLCLPSAKD